MNKNRRLCLPVTATGLDDIHIKCLDSLCSDANLENGSLGQLKSVGCVMSHYVSYMFHFVRHITDIEVQLIVMY